MAGGFVVLLDESDVQRDAALTDAAGHFELSAPAAGRYRLGIDRIGYLTVTTPLLYLPAGRIVEYNLAARLEPIELAGIDVSIDSGCRVRPADDRAMSRVWEEARKALVATAWSQGEGLLRYTLTERERVLDPRTLSVRDEATRSRSGISRGSPYVALPAGRLAREGYVRFDGNLAIYYAPDAGTLLSSAFLDGHCFRLQAPPAGDGDWIGLAFEPVSVERGIADIAGTLWLDRQSAELRRLEFRYTGLLPEADLEQAGGRVDFERLPTGEWIIRRWSIRMPAIRRPRQDVYSHLTMNPSQRSPAVLAIEEDSGEVVEAVPVQGRARHVPESSDRRASQPIEWPGTGPPPDAPVVVDAIEVAVPGEEARERRAAGESRYALTAAEIPDHTPLGLGELIAQRMPGVRHERRPGCSVLHTRDGVVGLVVVDGQRFDDTCVLDLVLSGDVERVELLPGLTASARYGRSAAGGVLVITTKH